MVGMKNLKDVTNLALVIAAIHLGLMAFGFDLIGMLGAFAKYIYIAIGGLGALRLYEMYIK